MKVQTETEKETGQATIKTQLQASTPAFLFYSIWSPNNKFIFSGRIMIGAGWKIPIFTFLFINLPFFLSIILVNIYDETSIQYIYLIFGIILLILIDILFFILLAKDPGIIPRIIPFTRALAAEDNLIPFNQDISYQKKETIISNNGFPFKVKYCATCNIYRPPRSVHCNVCDNCVERFDHHCPWLGTCVGRRNNKEFLLFLILLLIGILLSLLFQSLFLIINWKNIPLFARILILIVIILDCLSLSFVGSLFTYHIYLNAVDMTTNEALKKIFKNRIGNPYKKEFILQNFKKNFCFQSRKPFVSPRSLIVLENQQKIYKKCSVVNVDIENRVMFKYISNKLKNSQFMPNISPTIDFEEPKNVADAVQEENGTNLQLNAQQSDHFNSSTSKRELLELKEPYSFHVERNPTEKYNNTPEKENKIGSLTDLEELSDNNSMYENKNE